MTNVAFVDVENVRTSVVRLSIQSTETVSHERAKNGSRSESRDTETASLKFTLARGESAFSGWRERLLVETFVIHRKPAKAH